MPLPWGSLIDVRRRLVGRALQRAEARVPGARRPFLAAWLRIRAGFQNLQWQPRSGEKKVAHGETVGSLVKQTFKPRMGRQNNRVILSSAPFRG